MQLKGEVIQHLVVVAENMQLPSFALLNLVGKMVKLAPHVFLGVVH